MSRTSLDLWQKFGKEGEKKLSNNCYPHRPPTTTHSFTSHPFRCCTKGGRWASRGFFPHRLGEGRPGSVVGPLFPPKTFPLFLPMIQFGPFCRSSGDIPTTPAARLPLPSPLLLLPDSHRDRPTTTSCALLAFPCHMEPQKRVVGESLAYFLVFYHGPSGIYSTLVR